MTNNFTIIQPEQLTNLVRQAVQEAVKPLILQLQTLDDNGDKFLSRKEACNFLRVGATKFNQMRRDGLVTPIRVGMTTLYKKSDLLNLGTGDKGLIIPMSNQDSLTIQNDAA